MSERKRNTLQQIRSEPASLQVGKKGFSEEFLQELANRLKIEDMIKVKILKNAPFSSRKEFLADLELKCGKNYSILETRGWTVILRKIP